MALSKSTITGRVPLPTDENLQFAELTFALSGLDTEGASVLPGGISTRAVLVGSDIPAGFELWQNVAGLRGTHYRVLARWTVKDRDGVRDQYADLGVIQIGSNPSYTLADLINNGVPPAIGTFWSAITQAQYDAVIQAAADALASATAAALYDGPWLDTVAALIADTSLTYAPALPGTVVAGDYVQTRKEGFAYQVAASGASDQHVTTAGGVKLYVLAGASGISWLAFGVAADNITDDTAAVQAFANAVTSRDYGAAIMHGTVRVTDTINFTASGPTYTTKFDCDCMIRANFTGNLVVRFEGIVEPELAGNFRVYGGGGTTYSTRTNLDLVLFHNCNRMRGEKIVTYYAKRWGVRFTGTSSQWRVEYLRTWYCGGSTGTGSTARLADFTHIENTGSSGGTNQRSVIELATPVDGLEALESLLRIGDTLHSVMAVDGVDVTIYPWVENDTPSGTARVYIGGGLLTSGNDVSAGFVGTLDNLVCGVGLMNHSLYPCTVGSHVTQNCGVGHAIGIPVSSAAVAGAALYSYYESNDFDIAITTTFTIGYEFVATTALNFQKCVKLAPRLTGGDLSASFHSFIGVGINKDGQTYRRNSVELSTGSAGNAFVGNTPNSIPTYTFRQNSGNVNIVEAPAGAQRVFALTNFFVLLRGTGANDRPTGTLTFVPPAGTSINGGSVDATMPVTSLTGPTLFHCWKVGTDWRVTQVGTIAQAAPANVSGSGGSTVDTESRAAIDGLKALLVAAGVLR